VEAPSLRVFAKGWGDNTCGETSFLVMIVVVPIALGVPALVLRAPPSVILVPATFPLRVQVVATLVGLVTGIAMFTDASSSFDSARSILCWQSPWSSANALGALNTIGPLNAIATTVDRASRLSPLSFNVCLLV
jgi:hypothetical protein